MATLVKLCYFAITTLSTIGYGDLHPVSVQERVIILPILMFGVAVFSLIMSQYIEILLNMNSLSENGQHKDLTMWVNMLSRFNNGIPIDKNLISKIEDFFAYYWAENRLQCFNDGSYFLKQLPESI